MDNQDIWGNQQQPQQQVQQPRQQGGATQQRVVQQQAQPRQGMPNQQSSQFNAQQQSINHQQGQFNANQQQAQRGQFNAQQHTQQSQQNVAKKMANEAGNVAKQTVQQTMEEVKSLGKDENFDGSNIPKLRFGLRVSIAGAFVLFAGYFGGYIPLLMVLGYLYLVERNEWLEELTIKSLMLAIFFGIILKVCSLPSDALSILSDLLSLVGISLKLYKLTAIFSGVKTIVGWFEFLIFTTCALNALRYKKVTVPFVEKIYSKYM